MYAENLFKRWTNDSYRQKKLAYEASCFMKSVFFFLRHRCTVNTGHYHMNKTVYLTGKTGHHYHMNILCGILSNMLDHVNQNKITVNKKQYGSADFYQASGFLNYVYVVFNNDIKSKSVSSFSPYFYCKEIFF